MDCRDARGAEGHSRATWHDDETPTAQHTLFDSSSTSSVYHHITAGQHNRSVHPDRFVGGTFASNSLSSSNERTPLERCHVPRAALPKHVCAA